LRHPQVRRCSEAEQAQERSLLRVELRSCRLDLCGSEGEPGFGLTFIRKGGQSRSLSSYGFFQPTLDNPPVFSPLCEDGAVAYELAHQQSSSEKKVLSQRFGFGLGLPRPRFGRSDTT
jgi:hypothetical protein